MRHSRHSHYTPSPYLFHYSTYASSLLTPSPSLINLPSHFFFFSFFPGTTQILYCLPSLLKHEYIALCFIAQSSYEKAARMRVSPTPDIVIRVFMLSRGVRPDDVGLWAPAAADDGGTFWSNVVGIYAVGASDRTLFRVLEWGGLEVE